MLNVSQMTKAAAAVVLTMATGLATQSHAQSNAVPAWLQAHVGDADGQISAIVLDRARTHYLNKRRRGAVKTPCYMAMDATRPSTGRDGHPNERFYVICEDTRSFRAVSSGYGNGRNLPQANFANGRECARHFSNAEGSKLTAGGSYITAEARTSFKGYYGQSSQPKAFNRTFVVFEGEGEARNARERFIGGHRAMFLRAQCRLHRPSSEHADDQGYVPFGNLVDYTSGRSNGCTTWSRDATQMILPMVNNRPTALYIYPERKDITAVAKAVQSGRSPAQVGTYWNASCLSQIGQPVFWPKRTLEPVIRKWRRSLPNRPRSELPICN